MANHARLGKEATLRDVAATLDGKVQFIADTYAVMNRHEREQGSVVLRIGVSPGAKGKRPNYRIDRAGTGDLIAVIDGNNHKPWTDDDISLSGDWSEGRMTHADVRTLLSELREAERPGARQ